MLLAETTLFCTRTTSATTALLCAYPSRRQLFDAHKKDYVAMGADSSWLEKTLRLENE